MNVLRVRAEDAASLQNTLLEFARQQLQPAGLFVESQRAWLSLSDPLPAHGVLEVRPSWVAGGETPSLPLTFELRPESTTSAEPIHAILAVTLSRDVLVAARRLRKGSIVTCVDLAEQRLELRDLPRARLALPCDVASDAVALRDIAAGDVIRRVDVGTAPDVSAGSPVHVSVASGGISVTTTAIALGDAWVGDQVDVRLRQPTRTLRTRVIGPAAVQLMGDSP
jgi:flagella basal body P-ring formation protein FlgA